MTRDDILRTTHANFEKFFDVWNRNMDRAGMGALVVVSKDDDATANEIDVVYLTLKELRAYVSRFSSNDGFAYLWVKQLESVRGIPLVILPPVRPDINEVSSLRFSGNESGMRGPEPTNDSE